MIAPCDDRLADSCRATVGGPGIEGTTAVHVSVVMTDHPGWVPDDTGRVCRVVRCGGSVWLLTCWPSVCGGQETAAEPVSGVDHPPAVDVIDPASLIGPPDLIGPLQDMGLVARWSNPDAWDAVATAVIRQVIRAGHARLLYRAFCRAHGEPVETPVGPMWLFPTPQAVLRLSDAAFSKLGMAFKCPPLRALAEAFAGSSGMWAAMDPAAFFTRVQTVPRVGPWTAGASVADLTNDYVRYPFADLAVRTWAKRLAPGRTWPESEPEFAQVWARLAGDQVSALTLLTLAWGVRHGSATGTTAI